MKKILFCILFIVVFVFPQHTVASQQTEAVCYSQCLAYKFVWQGTTCYDVFADNCTEEQGNTIIKTIKFLKSIYDVVKSGDNIDIPFKAMFVCKPLIDSCIVPNQASCNQICQQDQFVFAPDLSVGHPESSFHGVYFDETTNQLYFKLVNNGMGYAWDIDVEATSGHTPNRDGVISNSQPLFTEKVEHLIYLGARNGPPKSFSDSVGDFLIEESLNGQYLHDFKSWVVSSLDLHSDSKNYNVPNYWIKAVPFTPKAGELNRITFTVDPNQVIPEVREQNNTFVLDIDLRPTPARYSIESLTQHIVEQTLQSFVLNFQVKNTGEESGVAKVTIYEGKFQQGKTPLYQTEKNIAGKNTADFDTTLTMDLSSESKPYCGSYKDYTLVVLDEEGNRTERSFSLPIYLGSVNGKIEDLFGKPVVGATVKAATGQETQSDTSGYYHLKSITTLGNVPITASHPDFSTSASTNIVFTYGSEFEACKEGNLLFNSVNLTLKDQDVLFTVTVKDPAGNPLNAQVVAVNSDFRKEATIAGTGPMPELQPGKYLFTVSAPGYKTIRQDVDAVPEQTTLEFVLEKLDGRPDDAGLNLIPPKLLWKKTLGEGERLIGNMAGTKNGKLLLTHVVDNKSKANKLFFLDLLTGNILREAAVPYGMNEQRFVGLDASYDGGTVGLFIAPGSGPTDQEGRINVFNASGTEIGSTTIDKKMAVYMDVSPDGLYLCPNHLFDKGLHKYSNYEVAGKGDDSYERNPAQCDYFLRSNHVITSCPDGLCEKTLANEQVRVIGQIDEGSSSASTLLDSTNDDASVVVRTFKKLYYFGQTSWSKEVASDNKYKSVAVSSGGMYTLVTEGKGTGKGLQLKVFSATGEDKTPDFPYKNVRFVFANDKGLFFAQTVLNQIELYQVGEYEQEYNPGSTTPTPLPQWIEDISYLSNGQFYPSNDNTFASLDPGKIYRADKSLKIDIIRPWTANSLGILSVTKDSLFAVDADHNPVLIKGQMTADFGSPATIYAITFDRYSTTLFEEKLSKFIRHELPEDEYFIVQNIHTKFSVKNEPNEVTVAVQDGEVKVSNKTTDKTITAGNQISIDETQTVTESKTGVSLKPVLLLVGVIALAVGIVVVFKKVKLVKK